MVESRAYSGNTENKVGIHSGWDVGQHEHTLTHRRNFDDYTY